MDGKAVLALVDIMQRDRNIPRETIFDVIESALLLAAQKYFSEHGGEEGVSVVVDRVNGLIEARKADQPIEPELFGRIAAQAGKQLMIQKFREFESQAVMEEYMARKGDLVKGTIQRFEHGTATVTLQNGKSEAILPRSEQIPGETHHVADRIDAVILDVKKTGHRVKIILSRTHPDFVRQLFLKEIPEIADRTIEIKAIAREAGYRTKVAVSSIDMKVDCVGACVGVRGSRIKNIVDALGGERIDIVRWNDALQVLIPNALQPATIEEVFLYPRLGRAIVLVQEDQLSLAIGRRGQNVRLASKLVGWDIEIMTHDELNGTIDKGVNWFSTLPHVTPEMIEAFIEEGFLSYDDLTFFEPADLAELAGIGEEEADDIIQYAEEKSEELGEEARPARAVPDADGRAPIKPTAASRAHDLFGDNAPISQGVEPKPTFENLFPDLPAEAPSSGGTEGGQAEAPAPAEPAVPATESATEQSEPKAQETPEAPEEMTTELPPREAQPAPMPAAPSDEAQP